ncbi:PREDICTED: olfactory receptor 1L4-like [Nanorana parkeri]|uniref:olfactory receptor 1L4-like n=1 Tax=Nanorana parkeri TaxID=125878 RepID=UPI00085465ED|nr:PREDICTED: olfactory receptor 1L4-like [Nanorana parkeri]
MKNYTSFLEFYIVPFSSNVEDDMLLSSLFVLTYVTGVLINSAIIIVIYKNDRLHSPMYLFLCNLSVVDMCYTTVIIPKLLYILISGNNAVSFTQCFLQMYFFFWIGSTEDLLLFTMAYDRYVAICDPLHYHFILSMKICFLLIAFIWVSGCLNSVLISISVSKMSFCHSTINHFFCDSKALTKISCGGTELFYNVMYVELVVFGLVPFVCTLASYLKIIRVILAIKSSDGRTKTFSTCSSHLIVLFIYYVTIAAVVMMSPSKYSDLLEQFFTLLYSIVAPMVNPLIYSLRNKDIKKGLLSLVGVTKTVQ